MKNFALVMLVIAQPIAAQTTETHPDPSQPEIVRRDSSISVPFPTPPAEVAVLANEYRTCIMSSMIGKPLVPPLQDAFENGIKSCAENRSEKEQIARTIEVAGWSPPGSSARAAEVTKLFDAIDDAQRSAAKMLEAQLAQSPSESTETEQANAPNH
jgi:hypothetical protein